jgi:oligopeptide/dipeptide ABC transporter ATP-binding protein
LSGQQPTATAPLAVIEVEGLAKHFPVTRGVLFQRAIGLARAVDGVSFCISAGETFGLVGESGCGKSTTARMILQVEQPTLGAIRFEGRSLASFTPRQQAHYRVSVQAVFQDPWAALNPRMRVGAIIMEPLVYHKRLSSREAQERLEGLLKDVGLRPDQATHFPHEFSGGQRQRIAIARALSLSPQVIVLDEPVSALDVSIRAQIMNLLRNLQRRYGLSYLLIAHNLATVRYMSHHVGVMYLGKIVEQAPNRELFVNPLHPYTRALIAASLPAHPDAQREEIPIIGEVPSSLNPPSGCTFHPRCPFAMPRCSVEVPALREVGSGHRVSCHLYDGAGIPTNHTTTPGGVQWA